MIPEAQPFINLLNTNAELAQSVGTLKWNDYIPHIPQPKQLAGLMLNHVKEVLWGGAAGGGKSDWLLMAALQYVDVPGYSAALFRKKLTDFSLPGNLLSRSKAWLSGTDAKWNGSTSTWTFPSGATLLFGYMDSELDYLRYQGAEFQFVGVDELTQWYEDDYRYLFSRVRLPQCPLHHRDEAPLHGNPNLSPELFCSVCYSRLQLVKVPRRIRAATNPGGPGHSWVKDRFDIRRDPNTGEYIGFHPTRVFIPAKLADNKAIDEAEYSSNLDELDPITREQLKNGDWDVISQGRFRKSWEKRYSTRGVSLDGFPTYVILGRSGIGTVIAYKDIEVFFTVDPAASQREGPGDKDIHRRQASWSAIGVWGLVPLTYDLILLDMIRFQKEVPDVIREIDRAAQRWKPDFIGIEPNGLGIGVFQSVKRMGHTVVPLSPRSADKLVRATAATIRMENGQVWFPEIDPGFLANFTDELYAWVGHPHQVCDQIDTFSYAAQYAHARSLSVELKLTESPVDVL